MMGDYSSYHCSVRGQRYVEREKPCEDSSVSFCEDGIHIAVVADGHGDPKCFRSNVGSGIACECAVERMREFAYTLREEGGEEDIFHAKSAAGLAEQLFCSILSDWRERVYQDLRDNPPTDEEYSSAGEETAAIYRSGRSLLHIYGTTLIAMLMTDKYLLVLHQGDGRCVVFHENGQIDQPVPWDPICVGRVTTSLCDENAQSHCRFHVIDLSKDRIIACYAETDGIEDSFETMDENNAYIAMLTGEYVNMGREAFLRDIPAHFSMVSRQGSRDDISLGCIIDVTAAAPYARLYGLMHEYYIAQGEHRKANERLNSMSRKYAYLTEQLHQAEALFDKTDTNRIGLLGKIRRRLELAMHNAQTDHTVCDTAENNLEVIRQEYDTFMCEYSKHVAKRQEAADKMAGISLQIQSHQSDLRTACQGIICDEEVIDILAVNEGSDADVTLSDGT